MNDELRDAAWAAEKVVWKAANAAKAAWAAVDQAKNTFHPDYNTEAVLVEEMQRMAAELEAILERPWVGLTEERIKEIWLKGKDHGDDWLDALALAKAFEAELKGLNK